MKFRCERDTLVNALSAAGRAVSGRGGHPALAGLQLEVKGDQLMVRGSDLDLTIATEVVVAGETDGVTVIPAKLLIDVVRSLPGGAVEVEARELDAAVRAGRSEFSIRTIAVDEFRDLSAPEGDQVRIDAGLFIEALSQVVPAASSDDSRPILSGVLMTAVEDGVRLVATDSYRLALRDLPGTSLLSTGQSVLVPSRALNEVTRLVDAGQELTIEISEHDVTFRVDGLRVTTRLIDGDFPNYEGLIPESNPNRLTVDRSTLLEAVKRVRLMAQESTPVRLTMSSGGLELVAITQDVGEAHEAVDASFTGEELTVAFNAAFLLDGVDVAGTEEVYLETVDPKKPAILRGSDDTNFLYLLMPVRVP